MGFNHLAKDHKLFKIKRPEKCKNFDREAASKISEIPALEEAKLSSACFDLGNCQQDNITSTYFQDPFSSPSWLGQETAFCP